jgi:hypothetical protein
VSNLNRQFLYREWDVKKMKSETAAAAAKKMNPHMNLKALTIKVAKETEDVSPSVVGLPLLTYLQVYTDDFWMGLTGVCNALDNVAARLYVDTKVPDHRESLSCHCCCSPAYSSASSMGSLCSSLEPWVRRETPKWSFPTRPSPTAAPPIRQRR